MAATIFTVFACKSHTAPNDTKMSELNLPPKVVQLASKETASSLLKFNRCVPAHHHQKCKRTQLNTQLLLCHVPFFFYGTAKMYITVFHPNHCRDLQQQGNEKFSLPRRNSLNEKEKVRGAKKNAITGLIRELLMPGTVQHTAGAYRTRVVLFPIYIINSRKYSYLADINSDIILYYSIYSSRTVCKVLAQFVVIVQEVEAMLERP